MFERCSEKTRRAIFFARYEASKFGPPSINTEHLLLGVVHESQDLLISIAGPDAAKKIVEEIRRQYPVRDKIPDEVDLPIDESARNSLRSAMEEADLLGDKTIEPQHLVMGLLREENCPAQRILLGLGMTLERLRKYASSHIVEAAMEVFETGIRGRAVLSQEFRKVVFDAINEATLIRSTTVKAEHLLLGLLRDANSLAAKILREAGLDYDGVRKKLD